MLNVNLSNSVEISGETMINNIVCFNITIKSKNERNFEEKEYISCDKT